MSEKIQKKKKTKKISTKLLTFIVPVVVIAVIALVTVAANISKTRMTAMAQETLESSISNQADNIEAWLDENLEFFNTVKYFIETQEVTYSKLRIILDTYYGYNSNSPDGIYIGTDDGKLYTAADSGFYEKDVLGSTWYKQGITRVDMAYGTAYVNNKGDTVVSATGIINDGQDGIKVMGADVTLNKISIIVNSGVKMQDASSFLVDKNDNTILAHRDLNLVSTTLSESSSDALLAGAAKAINSGDLSTKTFAGNMVAFSEISGTDWVLVSYIPTSVILKDVQQMGNLLLIIGIIAVVIIVMIILYVVKRFIAPLSNMLPENTATETKKNKRNNTLHINL